MSDIETKNARVISTFLGKEDHGIPTCSVQLDYGGMGVQSFGGWDLRFYGHEMIQGILDAVGAGSWEKLNGMYVRVRCERVKVHAIGHIIEDRWYRPEAAPRAQEEEGGK